MPEQLLSPALIAALDRFIEEQHPGLSRAAALAIAFQEWAATRGYLAPESDVEDQGTIAPEDLNASNDE
jgi:hypothetical protein